MNMSYGYDAVGNILSLGNSAAIPAGTALYGGTTAYTFGYDNLYELTSATGRLHQAQRAGAEVHAGDGLRRHPQHHAQDADRVQPALERQQDAEPAADLRLGLHLRRQPAACGKPDRRPHLPVRPRRQPGRLERDRQQAEPGHRLGRRQPHAVGDGQLRAADDLQIRRRHQPRRQEGRGRRDALYQPVVRGGLGAELEAGVRGHDAHRRPSSSSSLPAKATARVRRTSPRSTSTSTTRITWARPALPPTPPARSTSTSNTSPSAKPGSTRSPTIPACRTGSPGRSSTRRPSSITTLNTFFNSKGGSSGLFDPRNLNGFEYAFHNPVKYVDPDGRCPFCLIALLVGGMLAGDAAVHPANAPGPSDPVLPPPSTAKTIGA